MLHPTASAAGVRLVAHDTLGSTNAEALALARAGERGPLWITAVRQTAGRGRRGRTWVSEPGNLYATLLVTDACPVERAPELSFVSALALHDAVTEVVTEVVPELTPKLWLKWPNDLLADRAKLAGVLVEGESLASGGFATAIGIGLNCTRHPDGTTYAATDLATLGVRATPEILLNALSASMIGRLAQWNRGIGFTETRRDWLARAVGVGAPIRVRTAQSEIEGVFSALDCMGRLILARADGSSQIIGAGDVLPFEAAPSETVGAPR